MNSLSKEHPKHRQRQRSAAFSLFMICCFCFISICSSCNNTSTTTPVQGITCSSKTSNPVTLTVAYSSEKQAWMNDVAKDFNSHDYTACDGPITVDAKPYGSGQSMQAIIDGSLQPDVWSPAGNVWLTLINSQWKEKHNSTLIATGANDTPSLVNSPVVIAMWKPQAEALGWPGKSIGWADIAKISTDPQGWASYGHPEFGRFKFGHTHPSYSNSGLDAVIAMNYAATNKQRGLTSDDVNSDTAKNFVGDVESSVIHYGDSTGFFADKMFNNGPSYLSATVMYESLVIEANNGQKYKNLPYPVVAIYPKEGTFNSDHPYAVLQASWVTPAKKAAAQAFRDFLLAKPQQQKALQYGFRPAPSATDVKLAAPFDSAHGVDTQQPTNVLNVPSADVVQAILTTWGQQRRKVDVMLVLDRSGSMNDGNKIQGAKQGLKEFVNMMGDDDQLGLTVFSDRANTISSIAPLGSKRKDVLSKIDGIVAEGGTLLYDTIKQQYKALNDFSSSHIKSLVVLTDGEDTQSETKLDQLVKQISLSGEDAGTSPKIFTIAYGDDADQNILSQIANATGGKEYAGNPQNIKDVYQQISEFF